MDPIQNKTETARSRTRKPLPVAVNMEVGKLPPQALDLEEAVLGALMLEKTAVNDVIDILSFNSFYKESHQKIFGAIQHLFQGGQPIDILTVTEELKKRGELDFVGGPYYIAQLTNRIASTSNVEYHARIISQKYILRELIRVSSEVVRDAYDETTDVFDLLDKAESNLFAIAQGNLRKDYDKMSTLMVQAIKRIEELSQSKEGLSGVPSGFTSVDRVTSGFQPSDLIILAARPSVGKTSFALSVARNAAVDFGMPTAVFSLEMSSLQLVNRLLSSETELSSDKFRTGKLERHEWEQLNSRIRKLAEAPIFIDDTAALSVFDLRAKCRRLKLEHDVQLIIIDYIQLMTIGGESKYGTREQEVSNISRALKNIAKELNVPIIALSQLNRQVETRSGAKKPQLSDLRDSGAIEQDADVVMFIYRPEKHGFTEDEQGNSTTGQAEIIVAKHRNGPTGEVAIRFVEHLAKFVDSDYSDSLLPLSNTSTDDNDSFSPGITNLTRSSKMNSSENDNEEPF